jgi:hypothetical protein
VRGRDHGNMKIKRFVAWSEELELKGRFWQLTIQKPRKSLQL